jgi:hypothetical protein
MKQVSFGVIAACVVASTCDHSALKVGNRMVRPVGIVHERVNVPPPVVEKLPTRNHMLRITKCPGCVLALTQSFPVGSLPPGLSLAGNEAAHCHHRALHSLYVSPCGWDCGGNTPGFGLPLANAVVVGSASATTIAIRASLARQRFTLLRTIVRFLSCTDMSRIDLDHSGPLPTAL